MADSNAVGGLKWVKGEIVASLQRVRTWLETFVESGADKAGLPESIAALSEVRGVLVAIQLSGPALLAEEMQLLCEGLAEGKVTGIEEAAEALMLALIHLPDYLGKLQAGQADIPLLLLPPINDLRSSRGAPPLSDAQLLVLTSLSAAPEMPSPEVKEAFRKVVGKVRPHFHRDLLLWFRPETSRQGLADLGRLFHGLQRYIQEGVFHKLFLASEAVVEALLEGGLPADAGVKALIGRLDQVIKPFAEDAAAWPEVEAQSMLGEFLSLIARCEPSTFLVDQLRTAYGLESKGESGHAHSPVYTPGPEVMSGLVVEARKELLPIKDLLDLHARSKRKDPQQLLELEPKLRSLANTLAVTGVDDLVDRLRRCANQLGSMGRGAITADDHRLMAVAEELLAVESGLVELGGEHAAIGEETRRLIISTVKEARVEFAKAEQAIGSLVSGEGDARTLADVPQQFHSVVGALRVLGENDAAEILGLTVEQVRQRYLALNRIPPQEELELLAQAISGVELYMDGLREGEHLKRDLLATAREAVEQLASLPTAPFARPAQEQLPDVAEPLPDVVEKPSNLDESVAGIDPEFLDIFLEEAAEEEQSVRDQFARWSSDESDETALTILRRSFHTLKGSGRLVGAQRVGEFSQALEMLLNRVIDGTLQVSSDIVSFVGDSVSVLPDLIAAEADGRVMDVSGMIVRAEALTRPPEGEGTSYLEPISDPAKVFPLPTRVVASDIESAAPEESSEPEPETDQEAAAADQADAVEAAALADVDEELIDIFRTEAREHLIVLRSFVEDSAVGTRAAVPDEELLRSLHTLTGSGRMTGVTSTAEVTSALEQIYRVYQDAGTEAGLADRDLLSRAADALEMRLEHLPGCGSEMQLLQELAREADARLKSVRDVQPRVELEVDEIVEDEPFTGESPEGIPSELEFPEPEITEEDLIVAEATETFDSEIKHRESATPEDELFAAGTTDESAPELELPEPGAEEETPIDADAEPQPEHEIAAFQIPADAAGGVEAPDEFPEPEPLVTAPEPPLLKPDAAEAVAGLSTEPGLGLAASAEADSFDQLPEDADLLALFLEDAHEMLDKLDQSLRELQLAPTTTEPLEALQRLLHTLKGSARLSGLASIADVSHAFESLLTAITHGEARVDDDTLELAQRALDTLSDQVDAVENRSSIRKADDLVQALALALEEGLARAGEDEPDVAIMTPALPPVAAPVPAGAVSSFSNLVAGKTTPNAPQIRVRADVLNRLVNNAGEISIYRARLAQQSGQFGYRLGELDQTVERLREQLRKLEIETEDQILHRFERDTEIQGADRAEFDPLELDRFSTLQQLSRSLAETVNDLTSLRTLLGDLQGESETLLIQQARIANDLQDGLLRTRMVPFVQLVPRLHRVVRQTAQQMGKEAKLEVFGPEVELDRSIQDRIVAPLEHLLRNAVAHGIESPDRRIEQDKAKVGVISLILNREGNDVVITVADDGAGLDLGAIRRRAVERGLLAESAQVGEEELTALILESGFTTATEVTQIAGRGVGLDVVNSEIKQLSGSFSLDTQPGRGTSFTIRLPLTLAIIEALLVDVGGEVYAIPHATIEAASRIARADLDACYRGEMRDFSYGGRDYRVTYLGAMLKRPSAPDLGERRFMPVLLARAGEQRIAIHVDNLLGSQRIVVKPVGPQLSTIRWLSGGTILPDGRVALILDPLALIRSGAVQDYRPPAPSPGAVAAKRACIMVVDDSLTVRRVTSRMLSRQNMDVITAQDGVEALTLLEEHIPDLILLDIEMPRMDGYELTRHIRRSDRLKGIPLVMITSRTGQKHRRRAMELGVDRYLGKPYQETDLLDEISSVLAEASS